MSLETLIMKTTLSLEDIELNRNIRKTIRTLPISGLSTHAVQDNAEKARAAGCTEYMTKPVDEDLLFKKRKEILG